VAADDVIPVVREILSVVPAGCSWLLPVTEPDGTIAEHDLYHRGVRRVDERLTELYPSMVGGPLWRLYLDVHRTGEPGRLADFEYEEKRSGFVQRSLFDVTVRPVLGGLLVWWHRLDEHQRRLERTELLGNLGWSEYDLTTGISEWSPGMYRVFGRDPALGPMSRAEQAAAMLSEDRGLSETAWQTLDSGSASDVTVRFRVGGTVKHLRILSDLVTDASGTPLKINAVVQDVTVRENNRTAIERLSDQLQSNRMTALAEHRLAGQLQQLIQPVQREPLRLPGLQVMVSYLPAESAVQVGGDWYHAQELPDGRVALAVGDVAGHGLGAANGMAHLRFGLIAWLSIGIDDPAALLGHLNRLCGQLRITGTAVIGVYDPCARTLAWARAGHAPPLLARAGTAEPLPRAAGLLLGAEDDAEYPVLTARLEADDLLLFYTDGLIERRSPAGTLLGQVRGIVAAASADVGEQTVTTLAGRLNTPSPDDDTCTLTVRIMP
jgi:serine phosphatase RsbU (regulator of sigma subunit)